MMAAPELSPGAAYAEAVPMLHGYVDYLDAALAIWSARDDSKPEADARRRANDAMEQVDDLLAALHSIRSLLVGEIRASDDANAARADALLASARHTQVRRELSGGTSPQENVPPDAPNVTGNNGSSRSTGLDGRVYPSSRPRPQPQPEPLDPDSWRERRPG